MLRISVLNSSALSGCLSVFLDILSCLFVCQDYLSRHPVCILHVFFVRECQFIIIHLLWCKNFQWLVSYLHCLSSLQELDCWRCGTSSSPSGHDSWSRELNVRDGFWSLCKIFCLYSKFFVRLCQFLKKLWHVGRPDQPFILQGL